METAERAGPEEFQSLRSDACGPERVLDASPDLPHVQEWCVICLTGSVSPLPLGCPWENSLVWVRNPGDRAPQWTGDGNSSPSNLPPLTNQYKGFSESSG